ncbi:LysR family transcriptional regulator [Xanthobacter dioxanivorans]|uniref:LysR family transcriptional regulator n=1 Tax=Xanthobacter dioxanivorans TaxID=2528964 RepID=A0A974SIE6_9HYPH|nr:LysR family transcriptional regulator [Xanthobacter dioxanivorans]QRG06610.1 LysR family transcriptional regulator [Xanthobacter dioxanivorans]
MASLSVRIDLGAGNRIGPGKIELLEKIDSSGSISAAGRAMNMSYRRAWELVEEMNGLFNAPLVSARTGGRQGGGTALTPLGHAVVANYRAIEQTAGEAVRLQISELEAELTPAASAAQ